LRYNFGVGYEALYWGDKAWGDLAWIYQNFSQSLKFCSEILWHELEPLAAWWQEPPLTLASKVAMGTENWAGSRLRHSIYPTGGACTEHTDYGVITIQQSNASGFEANLHGKWTPLQPDEGYSLIFAGDMLERLTNGKIQALRHRVVLEHDPDPATMSFASFPAVRQSNILFVQPDKNTVVQPLQCHLRRDGTDLEPVRYGDWHRQKSELAFEKDSIWHW
jgi:hypothetical protein